MNSRQYLKDLRQRLADEDDPVRSIALARELAEKSKTQRSVMLLCSNIAHYLFMNDEEGALKHYKLSPLGPVERDQFIEEMDSALRRYLDITRRSVDTCIIEAQCHKAAHRYDDSAFAFLEGARLAKRRSVLKKLLTVEAAEAYQAGGNNERALQVLDPVTGHKCNRPDWLILKAELLEATGNKVLAAEVRTVANEMHRGQKQEFFSDLAELMETLPDEERLEMEQMMKHLESADES